MRHILTLLRSEVFWTALTLANGAIFLLPFLNHWHYRLDLLSHFQVQAVLAQTVLLALALIRRSLPGLLIASLAFFLGLFHLWPFFGGPRTESSPSAPTLEITAFNVLNENKTPEAALTHLESLQSDLIYLCETDPVWNERLQKRLADYPHRLIEYRKGLDGAMILSRHPFVAKDIQIKSEVFRYPTLHVTIDWQGTPIHLLGIHPYPPLGALAAGENSEYLAGVQEQIRQLDGEVLIVGDFNATPWSHLYRILTTGTNLRSAAEGANTFTTWHPYGLDFLPGTGLMIDHILHTPGLIKHHFHTGQNVGSDHRSVTAEFTLN